MTNKVVKGTTGTNKGVTAISKPLPMQYLRRRYAHGL